MNILVDAFPTAIEIEGREYEINTDYRTCLKTLLAFEDDELTDSEKYQITLTNLYKDVPENLQLAFEKAVRFLNGGKNAEETNALRLYSLEKDAGMIFSAFKQTHNVDLEKEDMHWWKFLSLFMDVGVTPPFATR